MLKAIIVDDEAPARSELRFLLDEIGQTEVVAEAASVREAIEKLKESFHETHKKQFGRSFRQVAVEIVNIRVIGTGSIEDLNALKIEKGNGDISSAVSGQRSVTFRVNGKPEHMMTTIYERAELKAGDVIQGPAIINQMDTTIVIEPDCVGKVNDYGIIVIDIN